MKILKKPLVLAVAFIVVSLLLSWQLFDDRTRDSSAFISLSERDAFLIAAENNDIRDPNRPPAAEDVLVQRLPGDNSHLLIMAYYSKESYSGAAVELENGFQIILKDDGKEFDKKAGDGLYTAKIPVNLQEFRTIAAAMLLRMKKNGFRPIRYLHREMILDPDALETFDLENFDNHEPVSISGLTLALATDATATNTITADASANVVASARVVAPTLLDSIEKNSIFITSLGVVEDSTRTWNVCTQAGNANGAWTFGVLMRQLASKNPLQIASDSALSAFTKNWLNTWTQTLVVNGDTVGARTQMTNQILNPWLSKSKSAGSPDGQLDMKFAPFKLTAITNRFDLRDGQRFGVPGTSCGEGRFVFCLIKSDCSSSQQMTIIFEYRINKPNTCEAKKDWAQQWVNLKNFSIGSQLYNQALQNITDQFTLCGTDLSRPNQSSLGQIRTNEIALSPNPKVWELREFTLDTLGNIAQTTVGQTPADKYNAQINNAEVQRMVSFVNKNKKGIKAGQYVVPLAWKGFPFLGGKSKIFGSSVGNSSNIFHWDGTDSASKSSFITDNDARSNFSLETCAGCHAGETQTNFTHVDPAFYGSEASLSGFLSGRAGAGGAVDFDNDSTNNKMTVRDAALRPSSSNPNLRIFSDIHARASGLKSFISTTCGSVLSISSQLMFQPTNMVH